MAKYRHTKGIITDNALQALLHDPLFRQRVEKNTKGKGSYQRKSKHVNKSGWEAGCKRSQFTTFTSGLLLSATCGYR